MTSKINNISDMWAKHARERFKNMEKVELENFREPGGINNRLASWDPYDPFSYRYYINILYNTVSGMEDEFYDFYAKIKNTDVGNPISCIYKNKSYNMDYLFSVQEIMFSLEVLKQVSSIVEIGPGFGRTCHGILENFSNIDRYEIIDIPKMLVLSKKYLKHVLPLDTFKKIRFIENTESSSCQGELFINIDSMQEMNKKTILSYLSIINDRGSFFYSRNAIGKYKPESIGLTNINETELDNAMKTGLCEEKIDIFNSEELNRARGSYFKNYLPSNDWILIEDQISFPWQFYHHALYKKRI